MLCSISIIMHRIMIVYLYTLPGLSNWFGNNGYQLHHPRANTTPLTHLVTIPVPLCINNSVWILILPVLTQSITRRMFVIEAVSRASMQKLIAKIIKGSKVRKVNHTFLPKGRPNPCLLLCLVSQLAPLAE